MLNNNTLQTKKPCYIIGNYYFQNPALLIFKPLALIIENETETFSNFNSNINNTC